VPQPIAGVDGELLQRIGSRTAVLFAFVSGIEPSETQDLLALFGVLGRYAATLHRTAAAWAPPQGFARPVLDAAAILDRDGIWGDWQKAPGVEGALLQELEILEARLRTSTQSYGRTADRFGLIHADMRLGNLLVDGDLVALLDFDDCGFGWFVYDLAASLSFIETRDDVGGLIAAWVAAYTTLRPLQPADLEIIPAMILLRRMALLAWIGSHRETPLAARHADRFARDTIALVERLWP
jgi:Ser/Thr protein kinase RdoA (MazF antagonist)